jgi:hypothetical protein
MKKLTIVLNLIATIFMNCKKEPINPLEQYQRKFYGIQIHQYPEIITNRLRRDTVKDTLSISLLTLDSIQYAAIPLSKSGNNTSHSDTLKYTYSPIGGYGYTNASCKIIFSQKQIQTESCTNSAFSAPNCYYGFYRLE